MYLKPEIIDETTKITNPFVKAIKDQRLDENYVTGLRKEVQILIEPFRNMCCDTADRLDMLEAQLIELQKTQSDFDKTVTG